MKRFVRILVSFLVWLIPISGIYVGTQVLYPINHILGFIIGLFSCFVAMPMTGLLFDAITNDRVIWLNVYEPWKSRLGKDVNKNDGN